MPRTAGYFLTSNKMATVDKAEVMQFRNGAGLTVQTQIYYWLAGVPSLLQTVNFTPASMSKADAEAAAVTAAITFAATLGDTLTPADVSFAFVTSDQVGSVTITPSAVSRSLNSAYQISATKGSMVSYSVDIATSVSLSGGAVGTVFLEYADDSGFTTNVVEVQRSVNGNTGTLVVGLTLNQSGTAALGGFVPVAKYVRLRTANTTGTPTFTYRSGQEAIIG